MERIHTSEAPEAIGPYSQAIKCDGWLYCSGQIPLDPATMELVGGDITQQTERVMVNITRLLAAAGCTLQDVVKTTVFISDMALFADMNAVYGRHFGDHRPARSTVVVRELPKSVDVEIECIARCP
jgi:2-iminobutanoate/2-iminopropanoate deaminase